MRMSDFNMPQLVLIGAFAILAYADLTVAAGPPERSIRIQSARWSPVDGLLMRGDRAELNAAVTISNTATSTPLGSTSPDQRGRWSFGRGFGGTAEVPCRVSATDGSGTDMRDVDGAPADCDGGGTPDNQPPIANANGPYSGTAGDAIQFSSTESHDPDGTVDTYDWNFGDGSSSNETNPTHTYTTAGTYSVTLTVTDNLGAIDSASTTATITTVSACPDFDPNAVPDISINSTGMNSACQNTSVVAQEAQVPNSGYSVLAVNDLGMHCGDLDTRVASILPPFQVLLAQVIQKGASPTLNPSNVSLFYSSTYNPNDPILDQTGGPERRQG